MKILNIRFQNLNSLQGTWNIDFRDPSYAENSLFAITGPTGAGKSTLLDAICLALYGQTPRLAKITKSSNEIMSRHTGVCFAEVEFTTIKGSYRCHWSQHRSRQKANGELQQPKHEIVDAASNDILESRMRNVANRVEEVTGMDFDRFTRSTLLAQGGFAAFLQASADKRAPILEQITGTEIYSRLSIKIHELRSAEQKNLADLEQNLSHISLLSSEEEKELQKTIAERNRETGQLKTIIADLRKQKTWIDTVTRLTIEKNSYKQKLLELAETREQHSEELDRLQPALAAKEIEPILLKYENLCQQQDKCTLELEALKNEQKTIETQKKGLQTKTADATTAVKKAEAERETGLALIARVQELDHRIRTTKEKLREQKEILTNNLKQKKEEKSTIKTLQKSLDQAKEQKQKLDIFFKERASDETLTEELSAIEIMINSFIEISAQQLATNDDCLRAEQEAATNKQAVTRLSKEQNSLQTEFTAAVKSYLDLQHEIREILQNKPESEIQQALFQIHNRQRNVKDLLLLLEEHSNKTKLSEKLQKQYSTTGEQKKEIEQQSELICKELTHKQQEIELLNKNILLLAKIQTLEEDRNQLRDGTPCPLCGATDHPYRDGNMPEPSKEDEHLLLAKAELADLEKTRTKLTARVIIEGEKQNNLLRQQEETEQSLNETKKLAEQLLSDLDFPPFESIAPKLLRTEEQQLKKQKDTLQKTIDCLETLRDKLTASEKIKNSIETKKQQLEKELSETLFQQSSIEKDRKRLNEQKVQLDREYERQATKLFKKLEAYAISKTAATELVNVLDKLNRRVGEWKEKKEEEKKNSISLLNLSSNLEHKQTSNKNLINHIAAVEEECRQIQKNLEAIEEEREKLFGTKETVSASRQLEQNVKRAGKLQASLQAESEEIIKAVTASMTLQKRLGADLKSLTKKIHAQKKELQLSIDKSIFSTLEELLASLLTPENLAKTQDIHDTLQKQETGLQALLKEKTKTLHVEKKKQLCKDTPEKLKSQLEEQEKQLEIIQAQIVAATEQLKRNDRDKSRAAKQLKVIESQKQIVRRWNRLHMLIGSADGKKFRNFAQGLTFEMMIHHANTHLAGMSDRYILVRDKQQPLDLNVIDTYQADEIRSTRNLSGGESFLVSLALALGLSRMASRNVRVDSLFLDEGFGTLDEDTLESALETLGQLREDNKLIGIISHVGALKERIPLQIRITPQRGGTSVIKGPGVNQEN